MARWGLPEEPKRPPPPVSVVDDSAPRSYPGLGARGFKAVFEAAVARKLRELKGRRWEGASDRARIAEARRRGAAELARRIERQTGHRPAASTIRKAARENRTPRRADQELLDRKARIDEAGGVKAFEQKIKVGRGAARRWAAGGRLSVGTVRVAVDVNGVLYVNGSPYPDKRVSMTLTVGPPASDELVAAEAAGDRGTVAELLSLPISEQYEWTGAADRYYMVSEIEDLSFW